MNSKINILIIDDDLFIRKSLRRNLEKEGFNIFEASHGKEADRILSEENISLIITDIFMPEKNGLEIITEIKKNNPKIKIIAISGWGIKYDGNDNNIPDYLKIAEKFGVDKTFAKPFEVKEIINAIRELLNAT